MTRFCFRLAEEKKEEGNQLYKVKQYRDALSKYTEAIGELVEIWCKCCKIARQLGNKTANISD